jgi:hypothetical protein
VFLDGKVTTAKVEMRIEQDLAAADKTLWTQQSYTESPWSATWPTNCTG